MSVTVATVVGIIGNILSGMVFLAPVPTFRRICTNRSTEGFQSLPYSVALFSSALMLYYGCLKKADGLLIIIINSVGCVLESIYLIIYIIFATRRSRIYTISLVVLFNFVAYGVIVACTHLLSDDGKRIEVVGLIGVAFTVCVFVAPLSIIIKVIRTRSTEFMPILLTSLLTLSAVAWLAYGLLIKDYYIAGPNIAGIAIGIVQIIVYVVIRVMSLVDIYVLP